MTGQFNLHACSDRTNVDRPAVVLSQCKEFLSVSTRISSKCSLWNAHLMLDYRNSYRRTVAAALLASSLGAIAIAAIALLITPSAVFPLRLATELLSLVCLAIAVLAGLVAAGGIIALHRDAVEQRGQPYYSGQPRECSPGTLARLRRRLLTLLPGSLARLRLWPGEWVKVRSFAEISATLDGEGRLDGMPFMLEMLRHCGQRHRRL